jgi:hypothetical protein
MAKKSMRQSDNRKSIIHGVDDLIDTWLGFHDSKRYRKGARIRKQKTAFFSIDRAAQDMSENEGPFSPASPDALRNLYEKIEENWNTGDCHRPTAETWQIGKELKGGVHVRRQEVGLERFIVRTLGDAWTNQLPTCSGEGNRSIDLVHECGDGRFEFIELKYKDGRGSRHKFGSDNPLHAAWEIVRYGLLYMHARANNLLKNGSLAEASHIRLVVLAPSGYYEYGPQKRRIKYNFSWLEDVLNDFFQRFCDSRGYCVEFAFEMFDATFEQLYDPLNSPQSNVEEFRRVDLNCRAGVYQSKREALAVRGNTA